MLEEYKRYTIRDLLKTFKEAGYPVSHMYIRRLEYKGKLILPRSTTNIKRIGDDKLSGAVREMSMSQIQAIVRAFMPGGIGFYDYRKHV